MPLIVPENALLPRFVAYDTLTIGAQTFGPCVVDTQEGRIRDVFNHPSTIMFDQNPEECARVCNAHRGRAGRYNSIEYWPLHFGLAAGAIPEALPPPVPPRYSIITGELFGCRQTYVLDRLNNRAAQHCGSNARTVLRDCQRGNWSFWNWTPLNVLAAQYVDPKSEPFIPAEDRPEL